MVGFGLIEVFERLSGLGAVRSKRHFSEVYLLRGRTYLRDFEQRGRGGSLVSEATVTTLLARLDELADRVPKGLGDVIRALSLDLNDADYGQPEIPSGGSTARPYEGGPRGQ